MYFYEFLFKLITQKNKNWANDTEIGIEKNQGSISFS